MILFKKEFIDAIVKGEKTTTVRKNNRRLQGVHMIKVGFLKKDERGYVKITDWNPIMLYQITLEMAKADGFSTIDECKKAICKMLKIKHNTISDFYWVSLYTFQYIGVENAKS